MQDLTALCVGDAVIDIFLKIPQNNPHFGLDEKGNNLFITLGEKIAVDKYEIDLGGNASNTAVGLSRLGIKTKLVAEIGKDEFAQKIINSLDAEKVNVSYVLKNPSEKTSFSVSLNYNGERTLLVEHVERDHNFKFPENPPRLMYLTSLGDKWEKAYTDALEYSTKNGCILAFNPGTRQIIKRGNVIWSILEKTDILFVNKEEAEELLYGKEIELPKGDGSIKKLLYGLKGLGPKNVVITDSKNGSYLEDESNKSYHLAAVETNVVEKTGAGDAYSSGFLAGFLNGLSLPEAMQWGGLDSSGVITNIGAQKGLLTKEEISKKAKAVAAYEEI